MFDSNDSQPQNGHLLFLIPTSGVWCRQSAGAWAPCPGGIRGTRLHSHTIVVILAREMTENSVCFPEFNGKAFNADKWSISSSVGGGQTQSGECRLQTHQDQANIRSVLAYLDCVPLIAMDINIFISRFIFGNKIIRSRWHQTVDSFMGLPRPSATGRPPGHRGPGANCRARDENTNVMLSVLWQSEPCSYL